MRSYKSKIEKTTGGKMEQLDLPLTLKFPLFIIDENINGDNTVIVRGKVLDKLA